MTAIANNIDLESLSTLGLSIRAVQTASALASAAYAGDADVVIEAARELQRLAAALLADFDIEEEEEV